MPETIGAAMEVPSQAAYWPFGSVLQMSTPGAIVRIRARRGAQS